MATALADRSQPIGDLQRLQLLQLDLAEVRDDRRICSLLA
jgi:hypothetical protein